METKPSHVVQLGDILDQYVFSKYARRLSISPSTDILEGITLAEEMWAAIKDIVPRARCYQLMGNHDIRVTKRIAEKMPELSEFFSHRDFYDFKGVEVLDSDRDYLEIDGVVYVHGWLSKSIDHAKYFMKPVVHGHRHRPAIHFENPKLWAMDCGHVADIKSVPLNYTPSKFTKWTEACGEVINAKPRLHIL